MWQHTTLILSVEVVTVEILFRLVVKNNHTACGYLIYIIHLFIYFLSFEKKHSCVDEVGAHKSRLTVICYIVFFVVARAIWRYQAISNSTL